MDYTNFVRTYYRIALQKLGQFEKYNGSFADFDFAFDIPEAKKHKVERKSDFLPNYDVNINAETYYFEQFLSFFGQLNKDLGSILLDKPKLVELYNILIVGKTDEAIISGIELYVQAGLDYLKEIGVIE